MISVIKQKLYFINKINVKKTVFMILLLSILKILHANFAQKIVYPVKKIQTIVQNVKKIVLIIF